MRLPKLLANKISTRGFTLIEILVVSAIISVLAGAGLLMGFDVYRSYSFHSELNTIVTILEKARSRSLANINQLPHGVHFDSEGFTLFEGRIFDSASPSNVFISKGGSADVQASADVVFTQLSGEVDETAEIQVVDSNSSRSFTITVNEEGRINW